MVAVVVSPDEAEVAADRLLALGASAVAERSVEGGVELVADLARDALAGLGPGHRVLEPEPSWTDGWRPYARTWRAGRFVVHPPWVDAAPGAGEIGLVVDPGRAFGSGSHPTTRLCLDEVDGLAGPGVGVLDVGCGSGVLAAAAAALGSRPVVAVDVDPAAVAATRSVAAANGLEGHVDASATPVRDLPGRYDLVLANLLLTVIEEVAPDLVRLTAPGGRLVVSGLLDTQADRAAAAVGLPVERTTRLEGWACLRLRP